LVDTVETELQTFIVTESAALAALDPALDTLAAAVGDAVLGGGKRIRPVFAYWGWRAAGGSGPAAAVVPALAALELLHAFALVHDDVMDCSDTRRGRPTAHRSLADAHRRARLGGDPQRFGESAAILVGDLCLVWADQLMARSAVPTTTLAAARRAYDEMRVEAIAGQFLDILGDGAPVWTVERALRTARLKTAGYTVIRPLQYGAALVGGSPTGLSEKFTRYGVAVGEAFQLRDDLLGAFGDGAVTGKPAGDDLASGKPTVLLQLARSRATARQLAEIDARVPHIAEVVRATGAPIVVEDMIDERVSTARRVLDSAPIAAEARAALVRLAESVAWRSS
jgi:geranylgeranyl diphosphate synthase type I